MAAQPNENGNGGANQFAQGKNRNQLKQWFSLLSCFFLWKIITDGEQKCPIQRFLIARINVSFIILVSQKVSICGEQKSQFLKFLIDSKTRIQVSSFFYFWMNSVANKFIFESSDCIEIFLTMHGNNKEAFCF